MIPTIGVTIKEDGKVKTGGLDYYKIFGKMSTKDYENMKSPTNTIDEIDEIKMDEYPKINSHANKNIFPIFDSSLNNQSLLKGVSNEIHDNLFGQDINEKLASYGQGVLNEDIFKNRKFSELKKNRKIQSQSKNEGNNNGLNNINGLVNIMNDKTWGHENKSRGITSEPANNNHGKIYRELGKVITETNNPRTRRNKRL